MIAITNVSGRLRLWRTEAGHTAIAAGATVVVEGTMPGLVQRRKWEVSGLVIRPAASRRPVDAEASPAIPSDAYLRTAEPREQQAAARIPRDWRDMAWPVMRSLAAQVCNQPIRTKAEAVAAIEAELERRG